MLATVETHGGVAVAAERTWLIQQRATVDGVVARGADIDQGVGELAQSPVALWSEWRDGCVEITGIIGGNRRIAHRVDGDGNRVGVGQGTTGTGVAQILGDNLDTGGAVVVRRRREAQAIEGRIDGRDGAGEDHAAVARPIAQREGQTRGVGQRQRAVGGCERDLHGAHSSVRVADRDEVTDAVGEHQWRVLVGQLRDGYAVHRRIVDQCHGDGGGGDVRVAGAVGGDIGEAVAAAEA